MKMELLNKYDCKTFNHKAVVEIEDDILVLYSYNTNVMHLDLKSKWYKLNHDEVSEKLLLSSTTLRHIREVLKQNVDSSKPWSKKEILDNEGVR